MLIELWWTANTAALLRKIIFLSGGGGVWLNSFFIIKYIQFLDTSKY